MASKNQNKNLSALELFMKNGKKGDEFIYYVGRNVVDRVTGERIPEAEPAFDLYEAGRVSLVQRRVPNSDGLFQFVMQKR